MDLNDDQKKEIKKILALGKVMGGSQEMDNMLISQMMGILMPSNEEKMGNVDNLLAMYESTGNEDFKTQAEEAYYKTQGIDPVQQTTDQTLINKFLADYNPEVGNGQRAVRNVNLAEQARTNPALVEQYYSSAPTGLASIFNNGRNAKEDRLRQAGFTLPQN